MPRPFRVPLGSWFVPTLGSLLCILLIINTSKVTAYRFLVWTGIGQIIYFAYGFRHSKGRSRLEKVEMNTFYELRPSVTTTPVINKESMVGPSVTSGSSDIHDSEIIEMYL